MDRYLDGSYYEPSSGFGSGVGLILALGALALLFFTRDGRDYVRALIYIFGAIFTIGPLLFNPSMFSIWWPLVVAIAFFSDRWEDNREKKEIEKRTRQYSSLSDNSDEISFSETLVAPDSKSQDRPGNVSPKTMRSTPNEPAHPTPQEENITKAEGSAKHDTKGSNSLGARKQKITSDIASIEEDQNKRRESMTNFRPTSNKIHIRTRKISPRPSSAHLPIQCPECSKVLKVPKSRIRNYVSIQCSACDFIWRHGIQLENTILMELKAGYVNIQLLPDIAPRHVERIKELARAGAYDNVVFHRVIEGFIAQTGDVKYGNIENEFNLYRAGTGGSDLPDLTAEFSEVPHNRGTLAAARGQSHNSANSQFFINLNDNHFLNGEYTVYGRIIAGMQYLDALTRGEPPTNPDLMISVKVAEDA